MNTMKKTRKKPEAEKPRATKKKPLIEGIEKKGAVRHLIYNGAFFRDHVTDEQYGKLLEKGKLGEDFEIKRRGMVSNPVIIIKVEFEGMKDIEIELEISGDSFRASKTLAEAGMSKETVGKVGEIEFALQAGAHELVDELIGLGDLDPGPALGGIENAFIEEKKKNSE